MDLRKKVGARIRKYREKKFGQEELAFRTGLHQAQIHRIETGKQRFNSDQIENIIKVLEIPVIRLFEEEIDGNMSQEELVELIPQLPLDRIKQLLSIGKMLQEFDDEITPEMVQKALEFIKYARAGKSN